MITRLRLKNFKNFADAELSLGRFTVVLGANASGKTNIRDAVRVINGIGRGYNFAEIIGGKWGVGGNNEWEKIRGAMKEILKKRSDTFTIMVRGYCNHSIPDFGAQFQYIIYFYYNSDRNKFETSGEKLAFFAKNGKYSDVVFEPKKGNGEYVEQDYDTSHTVSVLNKKLSGYEDMEFSLNSSIISQLSESYRAAKAVVDTCKSVMNEFNSVRFFECIPNFLRSASPPGQITLGDHGENLPTVLQAICADPSSKETLMEWVRALTPMDVVNFKFYNDLNGFVQLYLVESDGTEISAASASDGTLRFLALLAALLGPNPAKLYFFEEIESGIHPARLHLLIDMLERQTAKSGIQVVTTTHSPELLSLLSDETLKSTSIVYRPPGRSDAIIKPVLEFPNIEKLRASQGLGRLHAAGWFEDVLAATLDDKGDAA